MAAETSTTENWWRRGIVGFNPRKFIVANESDTVKVDAKAFFSTERTFYKYLHFATGLIAAGGALITVEYHGDNPFSHSKYSPGAVNPLKALGLNGVLLALFGMIVMVYSLLAFHLRIWGFTHKKNVYVFDDRFGPTALVALFFILLATNGILYSTKTQSPCVDFGGVLADGFVPGGVINSPLVGGALLTVGGGFIPKLAEINTLTMKSRTWELDKAAVDITRGPILKPTLVYLLNPSPPAIAEYDLVANKVVRRWALPLSGAGVLGWAVSGLAFIEDAGDPNGGYFFVATAGLGMIYAIDVKLKEPPAPGPGPDQPSKPEVRFQFKLSGLLKHVGALHYGRHSDKLYVITGTQLVAVDLVSHTIEMSYPMIYRPFSGVTVDSIGGKVTLTTTDGIVAQVPFTPGDEENGITICPAIFDPPNGASPAANAASNSHAAAPSSEECGLHDLCTLM